MLNTIKVLVIVNVFYLVYGLPQECGKSQLKFNPDWRVVGGSDAGVGEFPWQIILTMATDKKLIPDENNFCGGTIINENWILSAGHCVRDRPASNLKIRLGVHNFTINDPGKEVNVLVDKFIESRNLIANDISLLKLKETLDFKGKHKHLSFICLARSETKLTDKCIASGFGFINTKRQRPANGILKKVDLPLVDGSRCTTVWKAYKFDENMQICAGGIPTGGKAVCNGDSGGPLQCQSANGRWHQVGIVSYGRPCAHPNIPDVFTKVSAYVDWIEKTISSN